MSYPTNGYGERIYNPTAYNRAVSEDRYGYSSYNRNSSNSYTSGWNDGYSCGYSDGYSDGSEGWQESQLINETDHSWVYTGMILMVIKSELEKYYTANYTIKNASRPNESEHQNFHF